MGFDCSISPLVNYWGFYNYNASKEIFIDTSEVTNLLGSIGFDKIKLKNNFVHIPKNMSLDFNSLAQGFTVDLIGSYLKNEG